jgi:hypothetical protein
MTDNNTFAVTTANGIPMMFVRDPEKGTIRYYDRRYADRPGFTEYGQDCGPALTDDNFSPNATHGIRGWHEVTAWDLDARTVRLVGTWLYVSGFTTTGPVRSSNGDGECENGSPTCTPDDPCVICYDAADRRPAPERTP